MNEKDSPLNGYIVAAALGAIGGAVIVAIATRALPKMVSRMMAEIVQNIMAHRRNGDFNPIEL